jgi:hypothetical protein
MVVTFAALDTSVPFLKGKNKEVAASTCVQMRPGAN